MFGALPPPESLTCPECGASLARQAAGAHACDDELVDVSQVRAEIDVFEEQLGAWLATARGRFATWIAARDRQVGPGGSTA